MGSRVDRTRKQRARTVVPGAFVPVSPRYIEAPHVRSDTCSLSIPRHGPGNISYHEPVTVVFVSLFPWQDRLLVWFFLRPYTLSATALGATANRQGYRQYRQQRLRQSPPDQPGAGDVPDSPTFTIFLLTRLTVLTVLTVLTARPLF
jgi:hypothetical protein